jgi:hypothetical protein
MLDGRTPAAFGVENGDPGRRVGDDKVRDMVGLEIPNAALSPDFGGGLSPGSRPRELSCLAVIVIYLDAREPAVIFSERETLFALDTGVLKGL